MKFKLSTAAGIYSKRGADKLSELGFSFTAEALRPNAYKIDASDLTVNIDTLEELVEFIDKYGEIIMGKDFITIYDGYIE